MLQLFAILIFLFCCATSEETSGNFGTSCTWKYSEVERKLTISGTGEMDTTSGSPWKAFRTEIETVEISDGITTIGRAGFKDCSSLISVTIPNSITTIKILAFSGCSSLSSISIPDKVTMIGSGAFYGCSSLTSIDVSPSNQNFASVGGVLFTKSLEELIQYPAGRKETSYTVSGDTKTIKMNAFYGCSSLTSITIQEGVTTIGDLAFSDCSSLASIKISDSVTSIGNGAFLRCNKLTSIKIPEDVTAIGYNTFNGCSSLTSVTMSDKVTTIGEKVFYECSSLTSIIIPNSVTTIGNYAFDQCNKLTEVVFGKTITSIGKDIFNGCDKLDSVYFYEIPNVESCNALPNIKKKICGFIGTHEGKICDVDAGLFFKNDTCLWEYIDGTVTLKKGEKVSLKSLNEDDNLIKYAQGMTKLRVEVSIDGTDDKNLFSNFEHLNELYSVSSFFYFKIYFFMC